MRNYKPYLLILLIGCLFFIPFLGSAHLFDWDEINFAETSREMVITGNYTQAQVDYQQFWEKPPLFFWLQSASMHLFGINEFAARFPNAVCGILTLMLLFAIGKKLQDKKFAWLWVAAYIGSILPQFYFKSGIIDPWFNLFIFLGIYAFYEYTANAFKLKWLLISGLSVGLAALTKGPVGIGIVGLTIGIYYILTRFRSFPPIKHIIYYLFFIVLSILPWVLIEVLQNGTWFLSEFFKYQLRLATTEDASHGGFFGYHFVVILFFCFPASAFAVRPLFQKAATADKLNVFKKWMAITFWVVLILFSIVQTKIAHYSSMAYFPVTFLAAYGLYHISAKWKLQETILLLLTGLTICVLLIGLPILLQHPDTILPYLKDDFSRQALQAESGWQGWEFLVGVIVLSGLIAAIYFNYKKQSLKAAGILFITAAIGINLAINIFTPHIERYSQGAMVDFFESKADEDCYKEVVGFKSYAHLFYGERKPNDNQNPVFKAWLQKQHPAETYTAAEYRRLFTEWLVNGNIDKPAYFVTNTRKSSIYEKQPQMELLGRSNGYVFFKRAPQQ